MMHKQISMQEALDFVGTQGLNVRDESGSTDLGLYNLVKQDDNNLYLQDSVTKKPTIIGDIESVELHGNIRTIVVNAKNRAYQIIGLGAMKPASKELPSKKPISKAASSKAPKFEQKPENNAVKMSEKYLEKGYLDFGDRIDDGFFDGGRNTEILNDGQGGKAYHSDREVIELDAKRDRELERFTQSALAQLAKIEGLDEKIQALALMVSDKFGGSNENQKQKRSIAMLCEHDVQNLLKQRHNRAVFITEPQHGSCRYRSLLFKYIADRAGINSRLVRGDYGYGGGHAWNVVQFNNHYFIVDVMMYPSRMIHESAAVAEAYKRMGQNEKGGMGGKSIIG